jgi:hypothetical protein
VERVSGELSGAGRAQWLAELSEALEQAHDLMWKLGIGDGGGPAAMELYLRVEAARLEVQALRLGRRYQMIEDIDPEWTESLPWKRSGTDGC